MKEQSAHPLRHGLEEMGRGLILFWEMQRQAHEFLEPLALTPPHNTLATAEHVFSAREAAQNITEELLSLYQRGELSGEADWRRDLDRIQRGPFLKEPSARAVCEATAWLLRAGEVLAAEGDSPEIHSRAKAYAKDLLEQAKEAWSSALSYVVAPYGGKPYFKDRLGEPEATWKEFVSDNREALVVVAALEDAYRFVSEETTLGRWNGVKSVHENLTKVREALEGMVGTYPRLSPEKVGASLAAAQRLAQTFPEQGEFWHSLVPAFVAAEYLDRALGDPSASPEKLREGAKEAVDLSRSLRENLWEKYRVGEKQAVFDPLGL